MERTYIKNKNSNRNALKVVAILGVSIAFVGMLLMYWTNTRIVSGYDDLSRFSNRSGDVSGASTYCSYDQDRADSIFKSFSGNKKWLLLGPEFDFEDNTLVLDLEIDKKFAAEFSNSNDLNVNYRISGSSVTGKFIKNDDTNYTSQIDVSDYQPGVYSVDGVIDFGCNQVVTESYEFNVSYPIYVTWTQDWEGTEIKDSYLKDMEKISEDYGIPMTHFFNPRIYVTSDISENRAEYFTEWVLRRERENGDDIGLHLHMFPDMVSAAGVTPRTDAQRWGANRDDGYDVLTSEYTEEEMIKIFTWSKEIFQQKGLGDPVMYRAGGWFADEDTLTAAQKTGFTMDSSGRTAYQLGGNNAQGHWLLSSTTQPYRMNSYDQNNTKYSNMDLWEFPNNGGDSWSLTAQEMIERFNDNYNGKPLEEKKVVTYLSHPHWFNVDKPKLESLFTEIDNDLYSEDNGAVIYTNLSDSYTYWTLPDGSDTNSN